MPGWSRSALMQCIIKVLHDVFFKSCRVLTQSHGHTGAAVISGAKYHFKTIIAGLNQPGVNSV